MIYLTFDSLSLSPIYRIVMSFIWLIVSTLFIFIFPLYTSRAVIEVILKRCLLEISTVSGCKKKEPRKRVSFEGGSSSEISVVEMRETRFLSPRETDRLTANLTE